MRKRTLNSVLGAAALIASAGAGQEAAPAGTTTASGFRLWIDPFVLGLRETDVDTDSAKFEE